MCKSMGLDINGAHIEELVEECKEELTTEEIYELHSEQQKVVIEEEDSEDVSSDTIKSIMEK